MPHPDRPAPWPLPAPSPVGRRLLCYKPGHPTRLIYRSRADTRPEGRKSFAWTDYRGFLCLLPAAHQQLDGDVVLVWDNPNPRLAAGVRRYVADRDWLTAYQAPAGRLAFRPLMWVAVLGEGSGSAFSWGVSDARRLS
ncbi:hypothetical protein [Streptomyces rimosus]|uniref:hypothetical protein n=1 Tax=Streptomyces rimosus TaxID=1927 RepID=UPI00067C808F|nr:hypothetical protein [Streptomyces rimosus]